MECLPASSKYGELTSARDSDAVVAMDVRGACLLCARGTCLPVLYGESKEESGVDMLDRVQRHRWDGVE